MFTIRTFIGPSFKRLCCLLSAENVLKSPLTFAGFISTSSPGKFSTEIHAKMTTKQPFERLLTDVKPINYNLTLKPDLMKLTFEGSQEITVQVNKPTKTVTLNALDLVIKSAKFGDIEATVTDDVKAETATLTFPKELPVGEGKLDFTFTGELNDKMRGFYRARYNHEGEQRFNAVTQFEATGARRAFPCWDEPAVKATFDVTLIAPKNRVALSNMPVVSETPEGDHVVVKFSKTPIMSTYLLAFIVGEYEFIEQKDSEGVLHRVYAAPGKKEQGRFALDVSVKTLPFYKEYFGIAYPLPKIDLITIADFSAGAMENWGLVTYRENALLIDEDNSSAAARQRVALVVGHELAHQWFGNLVTMEWWTHLWLNEGFASWIEYLCVDRIFPEYDIWTQFATDTLTRALTMDALQNSHPIEVPVGHPDEVDEIFDDISYCKGASIIRMLHSFLGDKDYRKGMNSYLTKFQYSNTQTEDLWDALGAASGQPVGDIMTTWTKQMGYPVLKVSERKDGSKRVLTVTQQKFCADGRSDDGYHWLVPVNVSVASKPGSVFHSFVLKEKTAEITLENVKEGDWVKLNPGTEGVYRVHYSPEMLEALLPSVKDRSIPPRDRLGLQNDLYALARAGVASTVEYLKLAQAFTNEDNYTVWSDLAGNLGSLNRLIQSLDCHSQYQAFLKDLFTPIGQRLGWEAKEGEGHTDALLRGVVLGLLGRNGCEATVNEAQKRFKAHCDQTKVLPADLRGSVYSIVMKNGGQSEYDTMLKLIDEADLQEEKVRIMRTLGLVQDEKLIQKVLDYSISEKVRSQDMIYIVTGATASPQGRNLTWNFIKDKWALVEERYEGGFLLSAMVRYSTERFSTEEKAKDVEDFFKAHSAPAAERTIQQSLETIRLNLAQLNRDQTAIAGFLKQQ